MAMAGNPAILVARNDKGASPMTNDHDRALVLFSGGQDSATCLAWALERFGHVETVGFEYGQRHAVEMACRERVLARMAMLSP